MLLLRMPLLSKLNKGFLLPSWWERQGQSSTCRCLLLQFPAPTPDAAISAAAAAAAVPLVPLVLLLLVGRYNSS
jgi:hypothetical protein